jgi:phage terminase small subunit
VTPKQEAFVREYLIDLNATQAATRAGYSAHTANEQGARLLANVSVRSAVDSAIAARSVRTGITADRVLLELARIAFFDPRRLLQADGTPIPVNELDEDTAAALAGMDVMEEYEGSGKDRVFIGYTKKIKIADKVSALTLSMRHLGMLKDKVELDGPINVIVKRLTDA